MDDGAAMLAAARAAFSDTTRLYALEGDAPFDQLHVERWQGIEALSCGFAWTIDTVSLDAGLSLDAMLGQALSLRTTLADGGHAYRTGLVCEAELVGSNGGLASPRCYAVQYRETDFFFSPDCWRKKTWATPLWTNRTRQPAAATRCSPTVPSCRETRPVSADSQYFEPHFYPDGHVEVAITDTYSLPRLKLPANKDGTRPGARSRPHVHGKAAEKRRGLMDHASRRDYMSPEVKPNGKGLACATDPAHRRGRKARRPPALPGKGKIILACLFLLVLGACNAQTTAGTTATNRPPAQGQTVWLTLHGYNYTDHYIDNYYVDGAWGGNLFLSDSESGGGGGTCCVRWTVGTHLPVKVHVRWESSACIYKKVVGDSVFMRAKEFYSEKDVSLHGPVPADPQYFETHFYPDGHVEVAITDTYSQPRLKLPANKDGTRPGAKPWPKCTAKQLKQGDR